MKRLIISTVRDLRFGRHSGQTFEGFDSDFVVVYGPNESGKSTLAEFLTWAIGGPWRKYSENTEAFRGNSDGKVGGQLLGIIGTDSFDLQANFDLLDKGVPRDKRTGFVGGISVNGVAFQKVLGGIVPADFELMYRCHGATLGDVSLANPFEKLFAQFAMGGTEGVRNPREALEGLRKATAKQLDLVKKHVSDLRGIDEKINEAKTNPDLVEQLVVERDQISARIIEFDADLAINLSREGLISRVINGHEHRVQLDQAQAALADSPTISTSWSMLVDNVAEITDLAEQITSAVVEVERARTVVGSAAADAGMDVTLLEGQSLSAPDRLQIAEATGVLLETRELELTSRTQLASLDGDRIATETLAINLASTIGLDDRGLARLDAIETQLPELMNRADRWIEDTNKVIDAEGQLAGEVERRKLIDGMPIQVSSSKSLNPKIIAVAVLAVAAASVVHWGAAFVVALGAAAYFVLGRPGNSERGRSDRSESVNDSTLANVRVRLSEYRKSAQQHRELLDQGLGELAPFVTAVDLATGQLKQLADLASRRRKCRELDDQAASLNQRLLDLEPQLADAESAVCQLLEPRGISVGLVNTEFQKWLTKYETAVNANVSFVSASDALVALRDRMSKLTAPVASDVEGLTPAAIAARVKEAKEVVSRRIDAENAVRVAQAQFRGADLDSPEVREIMTTHQDLAELRVQLEITRARSVDIRRERDKLTGRLGEIRVEIDRLEGVEVLPGLLLRKGDCEDAKGEAETRHHALSMAHKLLGAAIEDHERDNQDPVVARASAMVAEVVPGWGTIIKTRDAGGKMLIQRLGADGRIGDYAISDGGRALLYLAIRLAFAQQDAERRQIALPIICDDPLIHFDDARRQASLRLLKRISTEHQVILFTCESDTRDHAALLGANVIDI